MNLTIIEKKEPLNLTIIESNGESLNFQISETAEPIHLTIVEKYGKDGESFTFEELTEAQKDELRFKFENFTPEQLEGLKGKDGKPLTFEDFTPEQIQALKPIETIKFELIDGNLIVQDGTGFQFDIVDGHLIIN